MNEGSENTPTPQIFMKSIQKFLYSIVIMLSISFLSPKAFAAEDSYLRKYFGKAVFLFEDKKYEEAIRVFEDIIRIEDTEGQYYFSPFAEVYIAKSKSKNIKLIPGKKRIAELRDEEAVAAMEKEEELKKGFEDEPNMDEVYQDIIDYYDEKQKSAKAIPVYDAEDNRIDLQRERETTAKETMSAGSGWTRLGPRPEMPKYDRYDRKEIVELRKDADFITFLYEKIDSGLENLDDDMLMFFEDQRFRNIARLIRSYKQYKR